MSSADQVRRIVGFIIITGLLLSTILTPQDSIAQPSNRPFMGINHQPAKLPPIEGVSHDTIYGILVTTVQTSTPAERGGLLAGDLMVSIGGLTVTPPLDSVTALFTAQLYTRLVGDTLPITVLRLRIDSTLFIGDRPAVLAPYLDNPRSILDSVTAGGSLQITISKKYSYHKLNIVLGTRTEFARPALPAIGGYALGAMLNSYRHKLLHNWQGEVDRVVSTNSWQGNYDDLRHRLQMINEGDDGTRLPVIAAIHRDPFLLEPYGRMLTDCLTVHSSSTERMIYCTPAITACLTGNSYAVTASEIAKLSPTADSAQFVRWFESQLEPIAIVLDSAYSALDSTDRQFIEKNRLLLSEVFAEYTYINLDENHGREQINRHLLELGAEVNIDLLLQAGSRFGLFIHTIEPDVFQWMSRNAGVRKLESRYGTIAFGSKEHDRWDQPVVKFIFDLGGDDFYANGSAVASSFAQPFACVIDHTGDDAYQSTAEGAQGCGMPGIGVLIDRGGDDTYIGSRWAQGAGYYGIGVLLDHSGNDLYYSTEFSQGSGLFGLGVLSDKTGNDRYVGTIHTQGVGFTKGLGLLLDGSGDDYGYCTGKLPTGYGDPGIYDGWGQGCGMGFRGLTSGGIGVVLDIEGNDKWEGGNFSQGGGYYYGLGIFHAVGKGDDRYIASRYGQGFSAHQAIGLFMDQSGNDRYTTRQGVNIGLAWDESVSMFIDSEGNDYYNGGTFFSLGASAHNSICLFLDKKGADRYDYPPAPARAGGNEYHGGTSLSIFLDLGGENDVYSSDKVGNNREIALPEYGLFHDGK